MSPAANPFHPAADPRDALAYCEGAVRADRWWDAAGVSEHWPLTTAEAAELWEKVKAAAGLDRAAGLPMFGPADPTTGGPLPDE